MSGPLWQISLDLDGRLLTALHHDEGYVLDLAGPPAEPRRLRHADSTSQAPVTWVGTSPDACWAATG